VRVIGPAIANVRPNPAVTAGGETSHSLDPAASARRLEEVDQPPSPDVSTSATPCKARR